MADTELTPKEEKFCQLFVETGNATNSYKEAYNSSKKQNTCQVEASKMRSKPHIKARIDQLKDEMAEKSIWRRLDSVTILAEIARGDDPETKASARVNAIKALNAMHGYDAPIQVENTVKLDKPLAERLTGGSKR